MPHAVAVACLADPEKPGARIVRQALHARLLNEVPDPDPALPPFPVLDEGESTSIRLALKLSASVLMDEKSGWTIAANLGLHVIGSAAVLVAAKKRELVTSVHPLLEAFAGNGYHFSDALVRAILMRAGEE